MSLRESQNFFYHLMATSQTIEAMRKDRSRVLKKYFRSEKDRKALSALSLERFETYRNHITLGILGSIPSAFPVIHSLVSEKEWNELLNNFYLKRLTRSPLARHVYQEFSVYLQKHYRGPLLKRMPYLCDLAHYESVDIALLYAQDQEVPQIDVSDLSAFAQSSKDPNEILNLVPILNPHHALRIYGWPVHKICREFSSVKKVRPGRYGLLAYRDPESLEIRFVETNPLVAQMVQKMNGKRTIGRVIDTLLKAAPKGDVQIFVAEAMQVLKFLVEKHVILGFQR